MMVWYVETNNECRIDDGARTLYPISFYGH